MRYPARHKPETRQRIVAAAADLFRERGLDAVSVADVMAAAGLTHGGFYAHFASKEELIAEALRTGRGTGADKLRRIAERAAGGGRGAGSTVAGHALTRSASGRALAAMVDSYLSPAHRARPAQGCVVAALGTEAGRHTPAARRALAERSRGLAQSLLPYVPVRGRARGKDATQEDLAQAVTACMVGGMILARLEEDPHAADRTLAACRRFILEALGAEQERGEPR